MSAATVTVLVLSATDTPRTATIPPEPTTWDLHLLAAALLDGSIAEVTTIPRSAS